MYPVLNHLCLSVANLDDCVIFYRRYCQMRVVENRSSDGEGSVYLAEQGAGPAWILQLKSGGRDQPLEPSDESHLGFSVDSRGVVDLLAGMARAEGIVAYEAAEYLPGAYFCGVRDPDGNCVEFGCGQHAPPTRIPGGLRDKTQRATEESS